MSNQTVLVRFYSTILVFYRQCRLIISGNKTTRDQITAQLESVNDAAIGKNIRTVHTGDVGGNLSINIGSEPQARPVNIELVINRDFDKYSEEDKEKLLRAIRELLDMREGEIKITKMSQGSVHLSITLPQNQALRLFTLVKTGALAEHNVVEISFEKAELFRANLRGADLRRAHLLWANLSEANLTMANLEQANLGGADLGGANLSEANLGGANLGGANLSEANLSEANLTMADVDNADLRDADLRGANLIGTNLGGANLSEANLSGANLRSAEVGNADLRDADLRGANLRDADLRGANLSGADLSGANLSGADLRRADLRTATLSLIKYDIDTKWPDDFDFVRATLPISER